jgi:enamine deaminase RidA (YjgF/YER057c/UK114 family)
VTKPMAIRPAHFPYFPHEGFTFSLGRQDGDVAWLSGHSGATWDAARQKMVVGGSMAEQSVTMYEKIGTILAAAGLGFDDVVHVVENVTAIGLDSYPDAEDVRREVFGGRAPTLTTVIVDRLVRRAALIEVQVTADLGGGSVVTAGPQTRWHRSVLTEAAGVVNLPTLLPVDANGEIIAPGHFHDQYRYCLERAAGLLAAAGLSLANVVRTVDYFAPAARDTHSQADRLRRELLGPVYPASASILMTRPAVPGALVALDVAASREPLELVNPGWERYRTLACSPAVRAGKLLFMSGFASLDMASQKALHAGQLAAQAEHTYTSILEVLHHAGAGAEDLIETIEYVTPDGVPDYRAVAGVRERLLSPPWPASVGAVCGGLLQPELLLEVISTAVLPS